MNLVDEQEHCYAEMSSGETIMGLYDRYARENIKGISADTLTQARRDVKLFADSIGNIAPAKITARHVADWKDLLMKWPVRAAEIAVFRGMTMRQVVKKNETVKKPTISDRTVNRHLSALGAFCDWLLLHRVLDRNPTVGLQQSYDRRKPPTAPFTIDQMNTIFASPLFTGCQSDEAPRFWGKPGNVMIRDYRYWVPLIMIYSGARPGEIARLAVSDIQQEYGVWSFHIGDEGESDNSVENRGSMRVVPVHPELIALGFIKYLDRMKAAGETRLFPNAERNQRGQMIDSFTKHFGIYLTRLNIKAVRGVSLYRFRHCAADALLKAGFLNEQFDFLLGNPRANGALAEGLLKQRTALMNLIEYPGLDLSRLKTQ